MSVMEMPSFQSIQASLMKLKPIFVNCGIAENYKVLFLQGGATLQFALIPLNFMTTGKADYINTGVWTKKAIKDAKLYGEVNVIATGEADNFKTIPDVKGLKFDKDASYVYMCDNNTIFGSKFKEYPETGDIPLICDMSSCFLSEPIDVKKFGMIYAGAQKNVGQQVSLFSHSR